MRQGCILSPLLFVIVINEIPSNSLAEKPKRGLLWNLFQIDHLEDLGFADDVAMMLSTCKHMQSKIDDVNLAPLTINVGKTNAVAMKSVPPAHFQVDSQAVENITAI